MTGATTNVSGSGEDRRGLGVPAPIFQSFNSADRVPGSRHPCGWTSKGTGISWVQVDSCCEMGHNLIQILSHANSGGQNLTWSADAVLTDTVACLQPDLDEMRAETRYLRTPVVRIHYAVPDS